MALDIRQYWKSIKSIASTFDPEAARRDAEEMYPADRTHLDRSQVPVWLVSLDDEARNSRGGQVVCAFPMVAGQLLADGTHKIATPEQVAAHQSDMERRRVEMEAIERKREGKGMDQIGEAVSAAVAAALAHASHHQPAQRGSSK